MGIFESIKSAFSSKAESDAADHPPGAEIDSVHHSPPAAHDAGLAEGEPTVVSSDEERTYTVLSGDTLWKISQEMYGDGSKYLRIFEANTEILKTPEQVFPGQILVIPESGSDS